MKSNLSILIALGAGIVLAKYLPSEIWYFTAISAFLLLIAVFTERLRPAVLAVVCGLSVALAYNYEFNQNRPLFSRLDQEKIRVRGKISEVKKYPFSFAAVLTADSLSVRNKTIAAAGKYLFYLNYTPDFEEGDLLVLEGKFASYSNPLNDGEFDWQNYSWQNHYSGQISYPRILKSQQGNNPVDRILFGRIQKYIISTYNDNLGYKSANFQNTLFLGVKTTMEKDDLAAFANSGTLHLLAVSGMHIAFLLVLLGFINRYIRLPKNIYAVTAITILFFYTLLTGASPSVVRAFVMAAFFLLSYPLKRMISGLDLLAGAGIFSLLINPNQLFSLSFQLSYLAVLSIFLIYQRIDDRSQKIKNLAGRTIGKWLIEPFNLSVAVSLGMLPLLLYVGSGYNLLSILINIPLVPLTTLSYLLGIILLITANLPVIGAFNGWILDFLNELVFKTVELAGSADDFILKFKADEVLTIMLFAVLVYFLAKEIRMKIAAQLVVCSCLVFKLVYTEPEPAAYIFAMEKGSAAFLNSADGKILCLNGISAYEAKNKLAAYLKKHNIRKLDYVGCKNISPEVLTEISGQSEIANLVSAEDSTAAEFFARENSISYLKNDSIDGIVRLRFGRIYFYQDAVKLSSARFSVSLNSSERYQPADYAVYPLKTGRKKSNYILNSGSHIKQSSLGGLSIKF